MAIANDTFRTNLPEFEDSSKYPDSMLTFQGRIAGIYCSEEKWGELYELGMCLAMAHFMTIAANNMTDAGNNGLVSSESAGDVSISFDTGSVIEERGGDWNTTSYGRQFIRMARLVGGRAVQL